MQCLFCKVDNDKVINSRTSVDGLSIKRRRECLSCGRRYTTYERIEENPLRVVKKDGTREPFDRKKILSGLLKACEKRPVSTDTLENIVPQQTDKLLAELRTKTGLEIQRVKIQSVDLVKRRALLHVYHY